MAELLETGEDITVCRGKGMKLTVVGMEAIVEHQFDVIGDDEQVGVSRMKLLVYLSENIHNEKLLTL